MHKGTTIKAYSDQTDREKVEFFYQNQTFHQENTKYWVLGDIKTQNQNRFWFGFRI